jgi:hypothetical protein
MLLITFICGDNQGRMPAVTYPQVHPKQSEVIGKLDFGLVPKKEKPSPRWVFSSRACRNRRPTKPMLWRSSSGIRARQPRPSSPKTPDWAKIEELLGIELNKALQAGSGGSAALDV